MMVPSQPSRFSFTPKPDAGRFLFQHSNVLELKIHREHKHFRGYVEFTLSGGFEPADGNLEEIAHRLISQYKQLPQITPRKDDEFEEGAA